MVRHGAIVAQGRFSLKLPVHWRVQSAGRGAAWLSSHRRLRIADVSVQTVTPEQAGHLATPRLPGAGDRSSCTSFQMLIVKLVERLIDLR